MLIGTILTFPAIFHWTSNRRLAESLVGLAALLEMGNECTDYVGRIKRRCGKNGDIIEPTFIFYGKGIHHTLALMIIPMNIYYYDFYLYWVMLAFAMGPGAVSYSLNEYSYLLDVDTPTGLLKM